MYEQEFLPYNAAISLKLPPKQLKEDCFGTRRRSFLAMTIIVN